MASIPQPPFDKSPESLHGALKDLITFIRERNEAGIKFQGFTQAQIDSFTDISYEGTIVYNTDAQEANVAFVTGGNIAWRAF